MKFSQRMGINPASKLVQREELDTDLENSLWNAILTCYLDKVEYSGHWYGKVRFSNFENVFKSLWTHHFKMPIDRIPERFEDVTALLRKYFYESEWHEVLDFVEAFPAHGPKDWNVRYYAVCNQFLERESSAYRFVNGELTEITSQIEIQAVEAAIQFTGPYGGAKHHLESALSLMNDRDSPNYRNSIKESISAVESVAKIMSGNTSATLGDALKTFEKSGTIHSALKIGFSALYGYTSDAEGIRHALIDKPTLQKTDAIYMLVTCSAFVNYLIALAGAPNTTPQ